jgi:hypothetical protein
LERQQEVLMRFALLSAAGALAFLGLQACSDDGAADAPAVGGAAATPSTAATTTDDRILALGLTRRQLEDADLKTAAGVEIGEVEAVITDATGAVAGLAIEVEGASPDRFVRLPLDGLQATQNGDDRDLQTDLTREQLLALPEWVREAQPAAAR